MARLTTDANGATEKLWRGACGDQLKQVGGDPCSALAPPCRCSRLLTTWLATTVAAFPHPITCHGTNAQAVSRLRGAGDQCPLQHTYVGDQLTVHIQRVLACKGCVLIGFEGLLKSKSGPPRLSD